MLEPEKLDKLSRLLKEMTELKTTPPLHRKQRFPGLWTSQENALHRDAKFTIQLLTFDKATLAYGLLKYRHRWLSPEGHVALLVGDLRKLGLFPALVALIISVATLFKENTDTHLYIWGLTVIVTILYLMAFFALSRERPPQVIKLLEYAIQHTDKLPNP